MKNKYGAECYKKVNDNWLFEQVLENYDDTFFGRVSLANGTEFSIGCFWVKDGPQTGRLFLGIEGKCSYTFDSGTFPSYVAEKLGLGEADANPMADFINGQFDNPRDLYFGKPDERYL